MRVVLSVWKDLPKYWVTLLRSSFIGCWLGITPGGAIAASFMGYNLAKRFSKDPESFGKGRIEGVFAPETAAHASGTAALLPMLALGIPGSGTAAILLGGLMVWGLNPGPLLFVEHKDFVWGLIASMYLGNVVGLVLVLTTVPIFASILRVPFAAVAPMIEPDTPVIRGTFQRHDLDAVLLQLAAQPADGFHPRRDRLHRAAPGTGPGRMRGPGAHHPGILRHVDRGHPLMHPLVLLIVDHLRSAHRGLLCLTCRDSSGLPGGPVGGRSGPEY